MGTHASPDIGIDPETHGNVPVTLMNSRRCKVTKVPETEGQGWPATFFPLIWEVLRPKAGASDSCQSGIGDYKPIVNNLLVAHTCASFASVGFPFRWHKIPRVGTTPTLGHPPFVWNYPIRLADVLFCDRGI